MKKINIPVSSKQVTYLAILTLLPLALSFIAILWIPQKPGQSGSDDLLVLGIIGVIAAALLGMLVVTAKRHVIEFSRDTLVVKHSLYTFSLDSSDVESAKAREVISLDQIGLSTRKNGIAAFGYFSGWFWGAHGSLTFCASSRWPVYFVTFEGNMKCRQLAISTTPEMARSIELWANS